jgi:hypothetical protein
MFGRFRDGVNDGIAKLGRRNSKGNPEEKAARKEGLPIVNKVSDAPLREDIGPSPQVPAPVPGDIKDRPAAVLNLAAARMPFPSKKIQLIEDFFEPHGRPLAIPRPQ